MDETNSNSFLSGRCPLLLRLGWILILTAGLVTATGCQTASKAPEEEISQVYRGDFESVWRACQKALINYPIRINNLDTGILQTDYVRGEKAYQAPDLEEPYSSGYRYRLTLRVVRGRMDGSKGAVKVSVLKEPEIQRDFFAKPDPLESDGLEEKVILYRIQREFELDQILQRAQKLGL